MSVDKIDWDKEDRKERLIGRIFYTGLGILSVAFFGWLGLMIADGVQYLRAESKVHECRKAGQEHVRRFLTTDVTCVPRAVLIWPATKP